MEVTPVVLVQPVSPAVSLLFSVPEPSVAFAILPADICANIINLTQQVLVDRDGVGWPLGTDENHCQGVGEVEYFRGDDATRGSDVVIQGIC